MSPVTEEIQRRLAELCRRELRRRFSLSVPKGKSDPTVPRVEDEAGSHGLRGSRRRKSVHLPSRASVHVSRRLGLCRPPRPDPTRRGPSCGPSRRLPGVSRGARGRATGRREWAGVGPLRSPWINGYLGKDAPDLSPSSGPGLLGGRVGI